MILPGITRDSVLTLAREHVSGKKALPELSNNLTISERRVTMSEIISASESGSLVELFGAGKIILLRREFVIEIASVGTAAVISTVEKIGYLGSDILIPTEADGLGPISRPILKELSGRQVGTIQSEWSVTV